MRDLYRVGYFFLLLVASPGSEASCLRAQTTVTPCLEQARLHFRARSFNLAQRVLWSCWDRNPTDKSETAFLLAQTYRELKNYESGLDQVSSRQDLSSVDHWYLTGYLHFRLGQFEESLANLRKAFQLNDKDWRVHHTFALNFVLLGRDEVALLEFRTAIALKPDNAELHYQLSRYLYTLSRLDDAVEAAQRALSLAPDYVQAHSALGLCYEGLGQIAKALEHHTRAVELAARNTTDEWPYLNFSAFLLKNGNAAEALGYAERALGLAPNSAAAHLHAGKAMVRLDRYKEARNAFEKAIALDQANPSPYYQLAFVMRKLGDLEQAQKYLVLFQAKKKEEERHGISPEEAGPLRKPEFE